MLTEPTTIPFEGEQVQVFAELDAEEAEATKHIKARRGVAVSVLLAGKGLLSQIVPGSNINVGAAGIVITPPIVERSLKLDDSAA